MSDRWWAPQRATVEPDAVVLAMLEPGDIGSSLLAVHRAGAAAIDTVAKGAVPSEAGLIDAMVKARGAVADKVVDSVSKSAAPSYAGLFVMDVFDDAEEGALSIYRTAVAKGVAPPIAAQRAGDVFGVPAKLMGKYAVMATDPRANPVAVRDLADRTLLEHVSHVVAVEQPHEEVSKANGDEGAYQEAPRERAKRPWQESDVVRDALGRFADEPGMVPPPNSLEAIRRRLGLTGAPSQVAGEAVAPREERQQRRTRRTRRERVTRRVVATGQQVQRTARRAAERVVRRADPRVAQQQAIAQRLQTRAVAERIEEAEEKAKSKALTPVPKGDMLAAFPKAQDFASYELDDVTVLRMGLGASAKFRDALRDQDARFRRPNEMIFRAGNMLPLAGDPTHVGGDADTEDLSGWAREAHKDPDYIEPVVTTVDVTDLSRLGTPAEQKYVDEERQKLVDSANDAWRKDVHGVDEDSYIVALPVYRPYGDKGGEETFGKWAIVHFQPPDPKSPLDRALPTVEEYVVVDRALGNYEGPSAQNIELDPNQIFRVTYNPTGPRSGQRFESFWDDEHKVIVNRWYLEVISEEELEDELWHGDNDVKKAEEGQFAYRPRREHKPWRESDVVRDALGRFAEEPDNEEGQAAQRQEQLRRTRRTRRERTTRVVRAADAARVTRKEGRRAEPRRAQQQAMLRAIQQVTNEYIAERIESQPDTPVLFDQNDFKVLTSHQWRKATDLLDDADKSALHNFQQVKLDPITRRAFAEITVRNIDEVPHQLSRNVDDDPALRSKQFDVIRSMNMPQDPSEYHRIGHMVDRILHDHPGIDKLEIIRRGDVLHFSANKVPAEDQNVIEVDPEIDWDQPVYLRYVGQYRTRNVGVKNDLGHLTALVNPRAVGGVEDALEGAVPNPVIHLYRLSSGHYRASN